MNSYDGIDSGARQRHIQFFNQMKDYHIDQNNNLFIHAGFSSMHGPAKEIYASNFSWDRTLWEMAIAMDKKIAVDSKFYPKRLKLFNQIFIGHTPTIDYDTDKPINALNLWNVDTGAAFDGKLTVMDIETKEFWQSDGVRNLYPNEKGRNKD